MNTIFGGIALLIAGASAARFVASKKKGRRVIEILQGATAIQKKRYKSPMNTKKDDEHYLWGCEFLNEDEASLHFLALGSTGSGKTINILLLMKSVVARMKQEGTGVRALAYDSKTDLLSSIRGMGIAEDDILVMNPFDQRRCAWDIAKDITTPGHAEDMASLLVPLEKGASNPYFAETAQALLAGMIIAFQQNAEGKWTLRDLVLASKDSADIKAVLSTCCYTKKLLSHFRVESTSENVCSTLATKLGKFESIAASWQEAERKFTIKEWLASQKMLVLGNSPKARKPIRTINQLLFTSIAKEIISKPGKEKAKHWFFLDELRELGALEELPNLMSVGRSKGAAMVLGFQDIHGLYGEYGKEQAQELVGQTHNFALLRINGTQPETQQWASQVAGQLRYRERKRSTSENATRDGTTTGTSTSYELRTDAIFIPSYFSQEIPKASFENGMIGIFHTKGNLYEQPISGEVLFTGKGEVNRVPEPDEHYRDYRMLEVSQLLEPWDDGDFKRLSIEPSAKYDDETTSSSDDGWITLEGLA